MICSKDFFETQSISKHFGCKLLQTAPAVSSAAAWQLSSIWADVIRTFRISNFEGCSGERWPVSQRPGSAPLTLCLTCVKTEHIRWDASNWHPPPLSPLTLFFSAMWRTPVPDSRSPPTRLPTHVLQHRRSALCRAERDVEEGQVLFQQSRWSRAAKTMHGFIFLVLRCGRGGPSEDRAKARSAGTREISRENEFHQFHF